MRLLWILALLAVTGSSWGDGNQTGELGEKEDELRQIRGRIEALQSDLINSEQRHQDLMKELKAAEQLLGRSASHLREIRARLDQQQAALDKLNIRRQAKQKAFDQQRSALARQLRAAYAMGRQERIKILLNQQDPSVVSRVMVYYDYFNRARTVQMERIGRVMAELDQISDEIRTEDQRLRELQAQELRQADEMAGIRDLRQELVVALGSDIRSKDQELKSLIKSEGQLKKLVDSLQSNWITQNLDTEASTPFISRKGKLRWPLKGKLSARFGTTKAGNLKWDGVMITAPEGVEVNAVHYGRVAFADWLQGFGLLLIIDHGGGYMSLYGHNQSLFKETGEWVEPNEPVALVGSSGGNTRPGVYFGIRHNGKAINPRAWCQRGKGNRVGAMLNMESETWLEIREHTESVSYV
ncbi:MAG: peptidoglycan DD-metalloendopeptidase family protein [Gammaproteobacteria bacterium]|nr:peptidoglycan DD-metalloendopeptidase family protein [Gammaproteobacteria bacterium]